MSTRGFQHQRVVERYIFPVSPQAVTRQVSLMLLEPTPGFTITRTRLFIEFRVLQYRLTGTGQLTTQWWQDVVPFFGVWVDDSETMPLESDDPIGGDLSDQWVIWGGCQGRLDWYGQDILDSNSLTYLWEPAGGLSESFAKRKTTVGNQPSIWLAWNWLDPDALINRAHGSFDTAYDLSINFGFDVLLETV